MKCRYRRIMIAGLAAAILCTNADGGLPVYGVEVAMDMGRIIHVNLNCYGRLGKINMIKGCSLNGLTDLTDRGVYPDVTSISNRVVPMLGDGLVTWNFSQVQKERLCYEYILDKDQIILSWEFDVSYKLNGVPSSGDQLTGASELVEIHMGTDPNDDAREYYRNNVTLVMAVSIDMGEYYGVEAENSQTQNLGETTAMVFTALSREEKGYTVRIGTDSFETTGVIMAVVPGTVEDLEHVKDLKEARNAQQDVGGELYDSLEQTVKSVEDMRGGVNQVCGGLGSAENAGQRWSNSKDNVLTGNDQALVSLTSVSRQLEAMIPRLQTAKGSAGIVHGNVGDTINIFGGVQDPLKKLRTRLSNIKSSPAGVSKNILGLIEIMQQLTTLDAQFQASRRVYVTDLASADVGIDFLDENCYMDKGDSDHSRENGSGGDGNSSDHTDFQGKGTDNTGDTTDTSKKNGQSVDDSTSTDDSANTGGSAGTGNTPGADDKNSQGTGGSTDVSESTSTNGSTGMNSSAGADNASGTDDKNSQDIGGSTGTDGSAGMSGSTGMDGSANAGSASGTPDQNDQGSSSAGSQDSTTNGSRGADTKTSVSTGRVGSGTAARTGATPGSDAISGVGSTLGPGVTSGVDSTSGTGAASNADAVSGVGGTLSLTLGLTIVAVIERHNVSLVGTPRVPVDMETLTELLSDRQLMLMDISKKSSELSLLVSSLMDDTSDSTKCSAEIVDNLDYLIEDLTAPHGSLDTYYPDLQTALDDPQEPVRRTTDALNSGINTMTTIQDISKNGGDDLGAAIRDSLRGNMELPNRSLSILDSTTAMRRTGRIMRDTIDSKLDKFDINSRFLFIGSSSERVSFTSNRNKAPKTLQVVLRTDKISVDEDDTKTADAEVVKTKGSPLRKIWNMLVQMWKVVVGIFKSRQQTGEIFSIMVPDTGI